MNKHFNINIFFSHRIQNAGLGGLRHNTVVVNWPDKLNKSFFDKKLSESFDEDEDSKMHLTTFVRKCLSFNSKRVKALNSCGNIGHK